MAYIRERATGKLDKYGNPVISYQVVWREPVRDEFGAPTGKFKQTSETFDTERKARAGLRKVENALDSVRGVDPSLQKAKANRPLGEYARAYLDSLAGTIDDGTIQGYANIYRRHIGPVFGSTPVAAITTADVARLRASLFAPHEQRSFVTRGVARQEAKGKPEIVQRSPKTVKHVLGTLKRILDLAVDDQAIPSNPVVAGRRHSTKRRTTSDGRAPFKHRPLSGSEVAAVQDWIAAKGNPVYALAVVFAAYTGVRVAELQGLQVGDVTLSDIPGTVGAVRIVRTKKKAKATDPIPSEVATAGTAEVDSAPLVWTEGTPKSDASTDRTIPLAPWLADDMRDYLTHVHPFAGKRKRAPLFPGRKVRLATSAARVPAPSFAVTPDPDDIDAQLRHVDFVTSFDWTKPIVVDNLHHNYFQPACKALGILTAAGNAPRIYDLRHTFATQALSAGEHYMQVSKWLGHSSFVLTLTTYADYIREDDTAAPAFERPKAKPIKVARNVVPLNRKAQ